VLGICGEALMLRQSIRSDAELGNTTPLESHRHIKSVTAEIELQLDGTVRSVGIIDTDLALSSLSPGYDANAVEELIARCRAFQITHHQPMRLRTTKVPV
jgi:hypothetical protein